MRRRRRPSPYTDLSILLTLWFLWLIFIALLSVRSGDIAIVFAAFSGVGIGAAGRIYLRSRRLQ